jgi:hypothetical protein
MTRKSMISAAIVFVWFASSGRATARHASAAELKAPSALVVVSATRSAVSLAWKAGDPQVVRHIVERKPLGASWTPPPGPKPSPIVTTIVDAASFTDTSIDPFATYVYRIRAAATGDERSAPSNEITVGPPPLGFSQIVSKPSTLRDDDQLARAFCMALDGNDDPMVAYLITDPDNNDDAADTTLHFIAWDRAAYKWKTPVTVGVTGIGDWNLRAGLSLAFDATTGRYGLAHMSGENELRVALSDDGVVWRNLTVLKLGPDSPIGGSSLALDRGRVYLANQEPDVESKRCIRFRTGAQTDPPDKWESSCAPLLPRTWDANRRGVSVAVDGTGKPGVVYWLNPSDDYNWALAFWRPGEKNAVKISDTADHQMDDPDAHLAFNGREAAVAFYARRDEVYFDSQHQIWVARSTDGGATWAAAVPLPADGGNSMGAPVQIAVSRTGRVAITAPVDGGNNGGTRCGQPKLIRQVDGKGWTICSAESAAGVPTRDARKPTLAFAGNDKLYVVFTTHESAASLKSGLVLWRER